MLANDTRIAEHAWSGGLPGYGDATRTLIAISDPTTRKLHISDGRVLDLPEPVNGVALSDGGQIAWQGHESGLIYLGLTSTGKKGYGQHSFLFLGETLHIMADDGTGAAEYQATAGGWRYVDDAGHIVGYGATYAGKLFEHIDHGGIEWGQGPNDNDGLCVMLADGVVRQFCPGNWHDIKYRLYGTTHIVLAVEYSQHVTRAWKVTTDQLTTLPVLTHSAPAPAPQPTPQPTPPPVEPPTMDFPNHLDVVQRERAKYGDTLTDEQCFAVTNAVANDPAVAADGWGLTSPPSGSGVIVNGRTYRLDKLAHRAGYINDILSGTPGPAGAQWGPNPDAAGTSQWAPALPITGTTPTPPPVQPPPVTPDDADLKLRVGALEAALEHILMTLEGDDARLRTLEAAKPPVVPDLSGVARKGDPVTMTGKVKIPFFGEREVVIHGTIDR